MQNVKIIKFKNYTGMTIENHVYDDLPSLLLVLNHKCCTVIVLEYKNHYWGKKFKAGF